MVRRAIGAAVSSRWWRRRDLATSLGADVPHGGGPDDRAGNPGHRRHRRRPGCAGLPQRHRHGAGLQHGHDQEPGRRPDRQGRVQGGPGGQGRRPALPDRPAALTRRRWSRRRRPSRRTRRSSSAPKPISTAMHKLVGTGYQTQQSYDQQKRRSRSCRPRSKGTRRRSIPPSSTSAMPTSARRSTGGSAPGSSTRAIWCAPTDNTALVTITQVKPIFVSFTLPQETLDDIREKQKKAPLVVQAYSGDGKTQLAEGKLTLIDNSIDQATGTIHLKARFRQRRRAAVAGRVRQRAADPVDAQGCGDGAGADRAGRARTATMPTSSSTTTRSSGAPSRSPRSRTASPSSPKGCRPARKSSSTASTG